MIQNVRILLEWRWTLLRACQLASEGPSVTMSEECCPLRLHEGTGYESMNVWVKVLGTGAEGGWRKEGRKGGQGAWAFQWEKDSATEQNILSMKGNFGRMSSLRKNCQWEVLACHRWKHPPPLQERKYCKEVSSNEENHPVGSTLGK